MKPPSRFAALFLRLALCLATALPLGSPQARATPLSPEKIIEGWRAKSGQPLVGQILRTRDNRTMDGAAAPANVLDGSPILEALELRGAKFVLLGEVHDNPDHHLLRASVIDELTEKGLFGRNAHPPVVTEHIRAEQVAGLEAFRKLVSDSIEPPATSELFRLLDWDKSGWPPARLFHPLYDAVIAARLRIVAGDGSRERIRAVARGGASVLTPLERDRLKLDVPFPQPLADALAAELEGSHCGMLPATAIPGMSLAQRYRDAHLADALLGQEQILGPAILLAGNGHLRTDRGVPWHVRQRAPGKATVSVMLIEVEDGKTDPIAYVPRDPQGKPAIDYIVFTPRAVREDPCEKMRAHMQKKG